LRSALVRVSRGFLFTPSSILDSHRGVFAPCTLLFYLDGLSTFSAGLLLRPLSPGSSPFLVARADLLLFSSSCPVCERRHATVTPGFLSVPCAFFGEQSGALCFPLFSSWSPTFYLFFLSGATLPLFFVRARSLLFILPPSFPPFLKL